MDKLNFQKTAYSWFQQNPARSAGKNGIADNCLFRMLYNSFCRRAGISRTFEDTKADHSYDRDCAAMFSWYTKRYAGHFSIKKGTKGQKRYVTASPDSYSFDLCYCDNRQFYSYLLTDTPQSGNQDLFCFIVHMGVAFMVPPRELDEVLQHLGFHPLHVRNIHHLAVYAVLRHAEQYKGPVPEHYNPFRLVKERYLQACSILTGREDAPSGEEYRYEDMTRQVRRKLFLGNHLSIENMDDIVRQNRQALTMRHSAILRDFHKLTAVYSQIFQEKDTPEWDYRFYRFVHRFCSSVSEKKFREYISTMIDNDDRQIKHPTKQLIILLWLYDYCFSFIKAVPISDEAFEKICRKLRGHDPAWEKEARAYHSHAAFDAYGFIHGEKHRTVKTGFDGGEYLAWLQNRLTEEYGWGSLNNRLPFDYYIYRLCSVQVRRDTTYRSDAHVVVSTELESRKAVIPDQPDTPYPLILLMHLLEQVRAVTEQRRALSAPLIEASIREKKTELVEKKLQSVLACIPGREATLVQLHRDALQKAVEAAFHKKETEKLEKEIAKAIRKKESLMLGMTLTEKETEEIRKKVRDDSDAGKKRKARQDKAVKEFFSLLPPFSGESLWMERATLEQEIRKNIEQSAAEWEAHEVHRRLDDILSLYPLACGIYEQI